MVAIVFGLSFGSFIALLLWVVFVDCILLGAIIASALWYVGALVVLALSVSQPRQTLLVPVVPVIFHIKHGRQLPLGIGSVCHDGYGAVSHPPSPADVCTCVQVRGKSVFADTVATYCRRNGRVGVLL
jgi:hypothetical protein